MGRIRRGGYVFVTWSGDHDPRHVHVYKNEVLIARWDLERDQLMSGWSSRRVRDLIAELKREGML